MKFIKYIIAELRNSRRFCILFVLNLSLGMSGFVALDTFKYSLDKAIKFRSKGILGADFGLSARRSFSREELLVVDKAISRHAPRSSVGFTEIMEMFTMVVSQDKASRLIQVKAIEPPYPFYGTIELERAGVVEPSPNLEIHKGPSAWLYPEILVQLKIKIGDSIQLGERTFRVADVIKKDSAAGFSTNMAPRIYISKEEMMKTNLVQEGSRYWYSRLFQIKNLENKDLENIYEEVFNNIENPDVQVYTHTSASEQMGRLTNYLNDFLGLASLVALFLAAVGSAFLFRSYIRSKVKNIAILNCLGLSPVKSSLVYLYQILLLGLVSSLFSVGLALVFSPVLANITTSFFPFKPDIVLQSKTIATALLIGTLGSFIFCLPFAVQILNIKPVVLLHSYRNQADRWQWFHIFSFLPAIIVFFLLSIWQANSFVVGGLFFCLFILAIFLLAMCSRLIFSFLPRISFRSNGPYFWAIRDLGRFRLTTTITFLAIGLGVLLLNLIPQIKVSIDQEIKSPETSRVPSLFLFDVQEEQVALLEELSKEENFPLQQVSPMVRARLRDVNGKSFDKGVGERRALTREEQREMRFRNRGFNLTYRGKISISEEIVKGRDFSGVYKKTKAPAELSVEKRFAERLGLGIGDVLTFDIGSDSIRGKVVNLRKVRWTSFQPNFFLQFQTGVLETAPKTFLATLPSMNMARKIELQNKIVDRMPNVSIVDVTRLVERLKSIIEQMSLALQSMALLCVLAGLVVLYSIANFQANQRRWDIGLLKCLGASFSSIQCQFIFQYTLVALFSGLLGMSISLLFSYVLSYFLFDGAWAVNLSFPLYSFLFLILLSAGITYAAITKSLRIPPAELLN